MTELRPPRPRFFVFVRRMMLVMGLLMVVGGVLIALVAIREYVTAFGTVRPLVEVRVHSMLDGVILDVAVDDGDRVSAGDLLLELDDAAYREQVLGQEEAVALKKADLMVAERELERLRVAPLPESYRFTELEVERAQARLEAAQERLSRQESASDKGLTSGQELADARAQVALARVEVAMAQRRQQLVEAGLGNAILREAEARVARIRTELELMERPLERARELLSRCRITAPQDGLVVRAGKLPGESVSRGELLMVLTPNDERRIFFRVPERDIVKVKPDQEVRLYSQLYPYRQYGVAEGTVYRVENWAAAQELASPGGGERRYEVRTRVTYCPYPGPLPLGSSVQGEILVGKKQIYRVLLGLD